MCLSMTHKMQITLVKKFYYHLLIPIPLLLIYIYTNVCKLCMIKFDTRQALQKLFCKFKVNNYINDFVNDYDSTEADDDDDDYVWFVFLSALT